MDAISLLTRDHRTVDELFDRFERTSDRSSRRELVDTMIEELSIHAAIEERELYPVMRRALPDAEPIEHAEHEHAEAKAILGVLAQLEPGSEHFEPMVMELIEDVRHHVHEEEDELFPQLRDKLSDDELEDLGQRLEQAKSGAPTKPSQEELDLLTEDELYGFAQKLDLEGRSGMNKRDLMAALAPN